VPILHGKVGTPRSLPMYFTSRIYDLEDRPSFLLENRKLLMGI